MTGATPVFALPYPSPGDPVADGEDTMQDLAEKLDKVLVRLHKVNVSLVATNVGVATVNFGVTYSALPYVVATPTAEGSSLNTFFAVVDSITTTSCRVVVRHYKDTNGTATIPVSLMVGGPIP